MMIELQTETPLIGKTKELCQTLAGQSDFKKITEDIEAFLADPEAQSLYDSVRRRQDELFRDQQSGQPLTEEVIGEFEGEREQLFNHPVAGGFIEAQQQMQKVQQVVGEYIAKTFELGRVPTDDEFNPDNAGGCCGGHDGGGCGCG